MKNCPTCGQAILPSMGEAIARKVNQAEAQTSGIRPTRQTQPADGIALTLHIGNSASSPRAETTPRGYKTQHVHKKDGKRYRLRLLLQSFPRRGTMGGKLTVIALGEERTVTTYDLPEQVSTYPNAPFSHDWQNVMVDLGGIIPVRVVLATV